MKRILLVVGALAAVATAAVWFAAEESYVTTVKAKVGTSLNVATHGSQNYGLIFGQEERFGAMHIKINEKAKGDRNLTGVRYNISCNDGATGPNASSICPNLLIVPSGDQKLVVGGQQDQLIQWLFTAPDCEDAAQKKVNPKTVPCTQDKNWDLSGAVSVDITGYQEGVGLQQEDRHLLEPVHGRGHRRRLRCRRRS